MTRDEALAELADMIDADAPPALTGGELGRALDAAATVDVEGRPPTHPDWVPTWDLFLAAAAATEFRAVKVGMQPGAITKWSADGATFERGRGPNWWSLADWWRSQSPLWVPGGFGTIEGTSTQERIPRSAVVNGRCE